MRCISLGLFLPLILLLSICSGEEPQLDSYPDTSQTRELESSISSEDSSLFSNVLPWFNLNFKGWFRSEDGEVLSAQDNAEAGDSAVDEASSHEEQDAKPDEQLEPVPIPGENIGTCPAPDPLELFLGRDSGTTIDNLMRNSDGDDEVDVATSSNTGIRKRRGIVGLKTILLRYFIMPVKRTLAFLFEEADPDTHFVVKKGGGKADSGKVECLPTNHTSHSVSFIPEGDLVKEMNTSNPCGMVLFYTPYCRFSMEMLPSYQALARLFPQLHLLAVMINSYSSSCIQFGAVGTPTVMLFHNTKPIRKMPAHVRNVTTMAEYVGNITDLTPVGAVELLEEDYEGVELLHSFDWVLLFSALFLSGSTCYNLMSTEYGKQLLGRLFKPKQD